MSEADNPTLEKLTEIASLLRQLVQKETPKPKRLLKVKDAASYLSVHPKTVRHLVQTKQLPVVRNGAGSAGFWLLDIEDLNEWIQKQKS